jgi:hypothetical protein
MALSSNHFNDTEFRTEHIRPTFRFHTFLVLHIWYYYSDYTASHSRKEKLFLVTSVGIIFLLRTNLVLGSTVL